MSRKSDRNRVPVVHNGADITYLGPPTPSPSKQQTEQREGASYDPKVETPKTARDISYTSENHPLTTGEKEEVEKMMYQCGQAKDRCIITNDKVVNYCHLVERKTTHAQLRLLTERWGRETLFDLNGPENIVKLGPTEHYMLDNHQLVLMPSRKLIIEITRVYTNLYSKGLDKKPKSFHELLPDYPKPWTYGVLPLDIDPQKRIFRHKTEKKIEEDICIHESTGTYEEYAYPYSNLGFISHVNPLCALWHAGVELSKLSRTRLEEINFELASLGGEGAEMANSMEDIKHLYDLWLLSGPEKPGAGGIATQTPEDNADQSPEESQSELDDGDKSDDVFQSRPVPEDDAGDSQSVLIPRGTRELGQGDELDRFAQSGTLSAEGLLDAGDSQSVPSSRGTWSLSAPSFYASSAPAGGRKRKKTSSPPTSFERSRGSDGSPTQRAPAKQIRKTGDGATASTKALGSPSLKLGSQSEKGTVSKKQLGEKSKRVTVYDPWGIGTTRGDLGGGGLRQKDTGKVSSNEVVESEPRFGPTLSMAGLHELAGNPDLSKILEGGPTKPSGPPASTTPAREADIQSIMSRSSRGTRVSTSASAGSGSVSRTGNKAAAQPSGSGSQRSTPGVASGSTGGQGTRNNSGPASARPSGPGGSASGSASGPVGGQRAASRSSGSAAASPSGSRNPSSTPAFASGSGNVPRTGNSGSAVIRPSGSGSSSGFASSFARGQQQHIGDTSRSAAPRPSGSGSQPSTSHLASASASGPNSAKDSKRTTRTWENSAANGAKEAEDAKE
ncbi:hypothetical protein K438DRAFT_2014486 [Mycena galopus ATCC 62051]|nr:hypothetical protein K438DRAFT_2014486 [Mycena galopus ATCC 62051]